MIAPGITPGSRAQAELLRKIEARGLSLERRGAALLLHGPGVHILAADLGSLSLPDTRAQIDRHPAPRV